MDIQKRLAELAEEIRHYPTPIARCDVQLTALLEERSLLMKKLEDNNGSCTPAALWINDGGFDAA
jgi:hypothetical protein